MGNRSHASVRGVGTINLKFTLGKIVQLRNVQHVPSIKKNLVNYDYDWWIANREVVIPKFNKWLLS